MKIQWWCETRVDSVDEDLLMAMKAAGCKTIGYGIESPHPRTLKKINKIYDIGTIDRALYWTRHAGIDTDIFLIIGFPWKDKNDYAVLRDFIGKRRHLISRFLPRLILIPLPNTQLYEQYRHENGFSDWWLKDKYSILFRDYTPYFEEHFYDDHFIEADFFNYSKEIRREIDKTVDLIGKVNLKNRSGPIKYVILSILILISRWLYSINPAFERIAFDKVRVVTSVLKGKKSRRYLEKV